MLISVIPFALEGFIRVLGLTGAEVLLVVYVEKTT